MNTYHKLLNKVFNLLTEQQKTIPYILVIYIMKIISYFFYAKIFIRNSYLHCGFVPGKSDLDFTCFYKTRNYENQKQHIKILLVLKKIFPFVGEGNYYSYQTIKYCDQFNSIEISQDPHFIKYIQFHPNQNKNNYEKVIFLLKKIEANLSFLNLKEIRDRQNKWTQYFSLCGYKYISPKHIDDFFYQIVNSTSNIVQNGYSLFYYLFFKKKIDWHIMQFLQPVDWSIHYPDWKCSNTHKELFLCAIKWELGGMWCQYRMSDPHIIIPHLDNMLKIIDSFSDKKLLKESLISLKLEINKYF